MKDAAEMRRTVESYVEKSAIQSKTWQIGKFCDILKYG